MNPAGDRYRDTAVFVDRHHGRKFFYLVDVFTGETEGWCLCEFADTMHEWAGSLAIMQALTDRQKDLLATFLSHKVEERYEPPGITVTIHEIIQSEESTLVKVGSGLSFSYTFN